MKSVHPCVGGVWSGMQLGTMFIPFGPVILFMGYHPSNNPKEGKNCMQNGVHCCAVCKSEKLVSSNKGGVH